MTNQAVGFQWLKEHFGLHEYKLTHRSYIGGRNKIEVSLDGNIDEIYGPKYAVSEVTVFRHLEFALKYDDLSLDFLLAVFKRIDQVQLTDYLNINPSARYTRRIGFLYEWLNDRLLDIKPEITGNYIDLLDTKKYITGNTQKNNRWKINDNLLGGKDFCPVVRKNVDLIRLLSIDFRAEIESLKEEYSPEIFNRATQYLYRKETRSSYEIEQEKPSPDRMNRFVALLYDAGKKPADEVLTESHLTALQNAIVDPRYKQEGYRNFQNYIGQSNYRMEELYHYICPAPQMVVPMMKGLESMEEKTRGISPVVRASLVSFGFVFIHPFLDGNGRIHRFLIHDMLIRDGVVGNDVIIPVSAHMVNNIRDYDYALETYSKPLMQRIQFTNDNKGAVTVTNLEEVQAYFKYPDLTIQTAFLFQTIQESIRQDLSEELLFLEKYDELKKEILQFIDMPDKRINDIIVLIHQNKGIFPARRKKQFSEITEDEFREIERMYKEVFSNK